MPQPAFSVSPASCTFFRMSSIESWIVPETVQLIVEVAGLCSSAPALEVMRPANGSAAQRPQETLVPVLAHLLGLDIGKRSRHTLVGVVHRLVDGRAVLGGEAILLVPDIERRLLERNGIDILRLDLHDSVHVIRGAPNLFDAFSRIAGNVSQSNRKAACPSS